MAASRALYVEMAAMIDARRASYIGLVGHTTIRCMAHDMADIFAADNPRFDRVRFLRACGFVEPEPQPTHNFTPDPTAPREEVYRDAALIDRASSAPTVKPKPDRATGR